MEKSFGLLFYIKKSKTTTSQEQYIYLRITVDGIPIEVSTKRQCDPQKWNPKAGRAEGRTEAAKSINDYLEVLQKKVYEIRKWLIDNDYSVTSENIKIKLQGKEITVKGYMLMEIFKKHNKEMEALVGRDYAPGTIERFKTSYQHTRTFLQWKYKLEDIDIKKLDFEFIKQYEFWLKSERGCNHNTAMKYLSNFKKIVLYCVNCGWLLRNPFAAFKMRLDEVDIEPLSEDEIKTIPGLCFPTSRLILVQDIFLFSCYSGLAFADVKKLKYDDIRIGNDGQEWIHSKKQKSKVPAKISLLPPAKRILEKYRSKANDGLEFVLPILSNQKMNGYLKEIADLAGIQRKLTYHMARHTFATTITLSNGIPLETVSKLLGHRTIRSTQRYGKILEYKICKEMKKISSRYK